MSEHIEREYHLEHETREDHEAHASHGIAKYMWVFLALGILTAASFFTYSDYWPFKQQPAVGWTFMMAVSCTKALLVMLFFMHLKYEASWKYVLTIPASVMALFLIVMLVPDVKNRFGVRLDGDVFVPITGGREASEERWQHSYKESRDAPPNGHDHDDH